MADKYNQKWVMKLAQKGNTQWAVTIGQTTYYSCPESEVNDIWRRHEDCHKQQWQKEGFIRFAVKYLLYLAKYGYLANPFEVEARAAENMDL